MPREGEKESAAAASSCVMQISHSQCHDGLADGRAMASGSHTQYTELGNNCSDDRLREQEQNHATYSRKSSSSLSSLSLLAVTNCSVQYSRWITGQEAALACHARNPFLKEVTLASFGSRISHFWK